MKEINYWLMKLRYRLSGSNKEVISDYFRKMGMHIGKDCNICTNITTTEPYLIHLGNNVTLAGGCHLVTHDNCVSKILPNTTDLFGDIRIGDNCFVGSYSIIMYGVTLADNIVVAAGSVVTKSFNQERIIIGGNPARVIGDWDSFISKYSDCAFNLNEILSDEFQKNIESSAKLITRRNGCGE